VNGPDHYKVLQVDAEAEQEVIQAAYRRLAQKYHPDVAVDGAAAERMTAINDAWAVLRDPGTRAAYDATRVAAQSPPAGQRPDPGLRRPPASSATSSPTSPASNRAPPPQETNRNWTSGRSHEGGGYDPGTMGKAQGDGAAGPPPSGPADGTVLNFGRYAGWSLGQIARRDIEYVEWLDRMPIGRPHREEIDQILRRAGRRRTAPQQEERRGLFRRR
jgi:curved DNA-binding protein CbpA